MKRWVLYLTALAVLIVVVGRAKAGIIISEYVEGSSNNKAIELYNTASVVVNLGVDGYQIQIYFNGSTTAGSTINLTGSIGATDTYVLSHSSADAAILAVANQMSGSLSFNGDDAVVLVLGGTILDSIGQIGFDPGTEWGSGDTSTADNTLRRKPTIFSGDANASNPFDPSIEWDGFPLNTFSGLGSHSVNPIPEPSTLVLFSIAILGILGYGWRRRMGNTNLHSRK
ncbi:lamin tail domain-containing protein [Candidatus Poribacteria bacterium]|nr:lamin tail domain-containing protein [Candidatus Poribacteria bacterium]